MEDLPAANTGFVSVRVEVDGCTSANSGEQQLIINPKPVEPELSSTFVVCEGDALQLFTNTRADGYRWTGPNGFNASSQYPAVIDNISAPDAGIYALVIIENGCESDPVYTTVVINGQGARPSIQVTSEICEGEPIVLQVLNPQPGITYQWIPPSMTVPYTHLTLPTKA